MRNSLESIIEEEGTIFRHREVFSLNYIPEILRFRDKEMKAIATYTKIVKDNIAPSNLELTGGFATGKTTAIHTIFNTLEKLFDNLITVHVNCQSFVTSYQIINQIHEKIFNKKPEFGFSHSFLYGKIMNELVEKDKILIVALDDYNHIKKSEEVNKIFYSLLRAGEIFHGAKVSLITITNCGCRVHFDPNVMTTFHPTEVSFSQYNLNQMYNILKERCDLGFYKGVIHDDLIQDIASKSFDEGNLRYGISLLAHAGEQAELDNSTEILSRHLY